MSYLTHLKRSNDSSDNRWVVKKDKTSGLIREVKLIYKPSEYYAMNKHKGEHARPLHNKNALIKILENDKTRRNQKMEKV
tara:strand:- start:123 stop:362 length:240 start_codon:yes stop_codon:yes gene_type:complete